MQRGTGQRHTNASSGQSVDHLLCLCPRIMSVCLPAHPQHGDKETLELSLRQTLQNDKNMQQAWEEGRGKGAGWGNGVIQHITNLELVKRASLGHIILQSRAYSSSHPLLIYTFWVGFPWACWCIYHGHSKPWAGKLLSSLSKVLLSTIHKGKN